MRRLVVRLFHFAKDPVSYPWVTRSATRVIIPTDQQRQYLEQILASHQSSLEPGRSNGHEARSAAQAESGNPPEPLASVWARRIVVRNTIPATQKLRSIFLQFGRDLREELEGRPRASYTPR